MAAVVFFSPATRRAEQSSQRRPGFAVWAISEAGTEGTGTCTTHTAAGGAHVRAARKHMGTRGAACVLGEGLELEARQAPRCWNGGVKGVRAAGPSGEEEGRSPPAPCDHRLRSPTPRAPPTRRTATGGTTDVPTHAPLRGTRYRSPHVRNHSPQPGGSRKCLATDTRAVSGPRMLLPDGLGRAGTHWAMFPALAIENAGLNPAPRRGCAHAYMTR